MKRVFFAPAKASFIMILAFSCAKDKDDFDITPFVNGQSFRVTTATASATTGPEIELRFQDASNQQIILRLIYESDTYLIKKPFAYQGKISEAIYINNEGNIFFGESGSVILNVGPTGEVSGNYNFNASDTSGITATISNGTFHKIAAASPPHGRCLLTGFYTDYTCCGVYSNYRLPRSMEFTYDSEGKIFSALSSDHTGNGHYSHALTNYIWSNGVLIGTYSSYYADNTLDHYRYSFWSYQDKQLVGIFTIDKWSTPTYSSSLFNVTFDGNGRLTTLNTQAITYNYQGDVSSINGATINKVYDGYDQKNNPYLLMAAAFHSTFVFNDLGFEGNIFSLHNVGTLNNNNSNLLLTYSYESYNGRGYPVTVIESTHYVSQTTKLSYSGCD